MNRTVVVISASLSESSATTLLGEQLAEQAQGAAAVPISLRVVELRDYFPEIAQAHTSFAPERLQEVFDAVAGASGIIAVTPIYNTSYAGIFKSFFDVLPEGTLLGTPVLIGATGGTPRHSLALDYAIRPMLTYLKANVLVTSVYAATEDWGSTTDDVRPLPDRIALAAAEFAAAVAARPEQSVADEFEVPASFTDMMRRVTGPQ